MLNILAVGPHPDDVELGMGGSILKFTEASHKVTIVDLTDGEPNSSRRSGNQKKRECKIKQDIGD
jgi:LmbE family N-acetylglucosaminyl deacetylase